MHTQKELPGVTLPTGHGTITGNRREDCLEFLGIRYAQAERFRYPEQADFPVGDLQARSYGPSCPQTRQYFEHLEVPERAFYHKEYRDGLVFDYAEDCLNLNVYTPLEARNCPVIVFIHGGGFNSGSSAESAFDGAAYAKRGVILVTIHYRVGVLGYLTHEELQAEYGHDGNFGLYDQLTAIRWVRDNISVFGGDPDNLTLMGQSAGAISIQYLCLCEQCRGLFRNVIMMSGGGLFPKFSLPRPAADTRAYWLELMELAGVTSLDALRRLEPEALFTAVEAIKARRKDNIYHTMPVIDGELLTGPVDQLIRRPLPVKTLLGYTNNDMYALLMGIIGQRYCKANGGYPYFFDINAKGGDYNAAFHSSDLRYAFGTLDKSHRPYDETDQAVSALMLDYFTAFAKTGDPNAEGRPKWIPGTGKALRFRSRSVRMALPDYPRLLWNMLTKGEPK